MRQSLGELVLLGRLHFFEQLGVFLHLFLSLFLEGLLDLCTDLAHVLFLFDDRLVSPLLPLLLHFLGALLFLPLSLLEGLSFEVNGELGLPESVVSSPSVLQIGLVPLAQFEHCLEQDPFLFLDQFGKFRGTHQSLENRILLG